MTTKWTPGKRRKSGLGTITKPASIPRYSLLSPRQSYPQHCPSPDAALTNLNGLGALGQPLSITEAAQIIGCSVWTIRQRYIPQGLPCLRSGPMGKLIFYRHQVIRWILEQQHK